jgi:hypothetical protein
MKHTLSSLLALALAFTVSASAQETADLEAAQKIALKLKTTIGTPTDAPLAVDADVEKPSMLKVGGDAGILFMPDRKLSAASITGAGSEIVPLGQLWMRKLTLVSGVKALAGDKVRTVSVTDDGKEARVLLFYVGARKSAAGSPELVLFAKDTTPLVTVPIESTNGEKGEVPVELSGRKSSEAVGLLTLAILGRHQAELRVMKDEE